MWVMVALLAGIAVGFVIHALLFRRKLLEKINVSSGESTLTPEVIQNMVERTVRLHEMGKKTSDIVSILDDYIHGKPDPG